MVCREVAEYMREKEGEGATCVLVAVAQSVVGAFTIKDPLKPEVHPLLPPYQNMRCLSCSSRLDDNHCTGLCHLTESCSCSALCFL